MKEVVRQLKTLKHGTVNPREAWVKQNRDVLLSQIKNTLPAEKVASPRLEKFWAALAIFLPQPMVYNVIRPIAVMVLFSVLATTAYSGTVKASYETVPGDWLYPAKRAAENAQGAVISLLGNKNTETKFHLSLATRRAEEVSKMIDDPSKSAQVVVTVGELKNELSSVDTKLEANKANDSVQATVAQDIKKDTDAIKNTLQDVKNQLVLSAVTGTAELSQQITETKNLAKDVSVKAVEIMVVKNLNGDTSVTSDDLKKAVNVTLTSAVADVMQVNIAVPPTTTPEVAAKVEVASAAIDQKIVEARQLVNSGNLTEAIDKIKEVSAVTKVVEQISAPTTSTSSTIK